MLLENVRYVVSKRFGSIELRKGPDGFWTSADGTIWAFSDYDNSVDRVDRCGVGFFSLPTTSPLTKNCKPHDYVYTSEVYQAFHTRSEADRYLSDLIENDRSVGRLRWLAKPFWFLSRLFGGRYWENNDTQD